MWSLFDFMKDVWLKKNKFKLTEKKQKEKNPSFYLEEDMFDGWKNYF